MSYTYDSLMTAVYNLMDFFIRIAGLAVVAVVVWYGLQMVMSRGDAAKFSDAKKGLTWSLVGALVIFGVWTIILSIKAFVGSIGQ